MDPFFIERPPVYALPVIPYSMESAVEVAKAIRLLEPDCIVTDLPNVLEKEVIRAASRLPEPTLIRFNENQYLVSELIDPAFEALRSGLERGLPLHAINPTTRWRRDFPFPDPYAIFRVGLKKYWHAFTHHLNPVPRFVTEPIAKKLKELSLKYDRILYVGHMAWIQKVLEQMEQEHFESYPQPKCKEVLLGTLSEEASAEIPWEFGWIASGYEAWREGLDSSMPYLPPDRQKMIFRLYKEAADLWSEITDSYFPSYHWQNLTRFTRNWSILRDNLLPDLYQIVTAAKGCVEDSYALAVWQLATEYPYLSNIDNLPSWDLKPDEVWGTKQLIHFRLKEKGRKSGLFSRKEKGDRKWRFTPPGPFTICSYQPEDHIIEDFGEFLRKKGTQLVQEEGAKTAPFSGSLEDGIDVKETIRHWPEKKLYIRTSGKPPGVVGSVVMIFDEDAPEEGENYVEKYPWKTTWLGEHDQESDMALYATPITQNVVGPGISRCEYGGFMMSYPPRRMFDIWQDSDYANLTKKSEVLLMAAIDYSTESMIVYAANSPPRAYFKKFAARFGKKVIYYPLKQISPITRNRVRTFHVLDGHDRRGIADEYII